MQLLSRTPPPPIRPCSFLPSYFTSKIKASANPITGCQSSRYRRNSSQGESLARISLRIFIQQCDVIESSLSLWSHLVTVFIHFLAQLPGKISQFVFGRRRIFSYLSEQGERATGDGGGAHGGREDGRVRGRGGGRREDGRRGRSGQGRRVRGGRGKHGRGRRGGGRRGRGEGRRVRRGAEILPVLLSMRGPVQQRHRPIPSAVQVL